MENTKVYRGQVIRVQWNKTDAQWYFCITDVLNILLKIKDSRPEWRKLKRKHPETETLCFGFKMQDANEQNRIIECANKYGILRIINILPETIDNELFKVWLARM